MHCSMFTAGQAASLFGLLVSCVAAAAPVQPRITFGKSFEGGSLGRIQVVGETHFRCFVEGQYDEHGRNRQASWYCFRMEGVKDRDITLTLTDFVGEYNGKRGACPMSADTIPVFSHDAECWQHFPAMDWDADLKEATVRFTSPQDRIWIAHVPPYPHSRLLRLLDQLDDASCVRIEVIGKTVQGRDLHLVTVTNFDKPDQDKRTVWLQARQHAWEAPTSRVMEGALRFIASADPRAGALRDRVVFKFTPMLDPDGCASGKVRFNAHGYDLNRHWDEVDLRRKEFLRRMPEIWYAKKAILGFLAAGGRLDLMINLHNTETAEYLETQADDPATLERMQRLMGRLKNQTSFDPSSGLRVSTKPDSTTNALWRQSQVPVLLMEQRIATSRKLSRRPTVDDRLNFGRELVMAMAETVLE